MHASGSIVSTTKGGPFRQFNDRFERHFRKSTVKETLAYYYSPGPGRLRRKEERSPQWGGMVNVVSKK
jgi:hypothetical protein